MATDEYCCVATARLPCRGACLIVMPRGDFLEMPSSESGPSDVLVNDWDMNLATLGLCAETALQLSILKAVAP